jgi:tryptophanyl-tRNA synthetase
VRAATQQVLWHPVEERRRVSIPSAKRVRTVLTGIKPTGKPHLGNYLGAMLPALELARSHRALLFIADYHALTDLAEVKTVREQTYEVAAAWLAAGLDPKSVTFYRQSDIPEVFELFWLLSCATPKGMMNRAHAYKALVEANEALKRDPDHGVNMGLFGYPVLMASDILLFDVDVVPVGKDQSQHVEMARDIAQRFNHEVGAVLRVPELVLAAEPEPVLGLDGRKMSKSYDNTIPLFAPRDELGRLLRRYKTDSSAAAAPKDPDANGLFRIYAAFAAPAEAAAARTALVAGTMTWGELKARTLEALDAVLAPLRERYEALLSDPAQIDRILADGARRARPLAAETMQRVRRAVGVGV